MTTPPGQPFQANDDTVAARLEVDVPADAINNLSELGRLTADIRANMEATAKYNQDYVEYLRELPNTIGEVDAAQARMVQGQSAIFGGGDMTPIPRDPFVGREAPSAGMTSFPGRAGAGRPMRGIDQDALIDLARNNPRQVANMAADRGLDDYFDDDQSYTLPRPAPRPGPRPGAGREMQFSGGGRPPSSPRSPRSSTGPGDDDGRAAGTTTGRQVTPEGTEPQAERAAKRLLVELGKRDDGRDLGQRARDLGQGFENNSLLNFLTNEGGIRGRGNWLDMGGQLGRMGQQSAERFGQQAQQAQETRENLLSNAAAVAATNPQLAQQLTERAQGMSGRVDMMGRIAPLMRGAGIVGGVVAGGAAIGAGVQKAGSTYQDIRGEGLQQGGGFAEGAAFEAQIRTMAMNPFLSTEQSRRIMQSALQTGYTGKEFDTMTEFMAENLKQMNIDVAQSTQLLQNNVLRGGQSMESVQAQLSQNTAMAANVNMSQSQINDAYMQLSNQFIQGGMGGQQAGELAQLYSTTFANNPVLRDSGANLLAGLQSNPSFQNYFASRSGARGAGIASSNATMWAGDTLSSEENLQASVEAMGDMLRPFVGMFTSGDENLRYRAIQQAASRLRVNNNEAQALLEEYASGDLLNRPAEAQREWEEVGGGRMNTNMELTPIEGDIREVGGAIRDAGSYVRMGWNRLTGDHEQAEEVAGRRDERSNRRRLDRQIAEAGPKTYTPEVLEQLALSEYGGSINDVTIVDENGNERKISSGDLQSEETMKRLQSGQIKVKTEGGGVQTLRDWGNTQNTDETGGAGNGQQIGLTEEARRFFRIEGPNPVQQQADQGRASRNSMDAQRLGFGVQQGGS